MIAQMADRFILYSGGAPGTDTVFGTNAEWYGISEQHYSFRGHENCRSRGRVILNERQLECGNAELREILGSRFDKSHGHTLKYWQRNWWQVQESKEVFVVVQDLPAFLDFTNDAIESAAVAVGVAIKKRAECKRVWAYDQKSDRWLQWRRGSDKGTSVRYRISEDDWETFYFREVDTEAVIITETGFAGIGSRNISDAAVDAITDLFKRSFGSVREAG